MTPRDDEWDEEFEWVEDEPEGVFHADPEQRRGLAVGALAMVPLLAAYEFARHADVGRRNAAEMMLLRWLEPFDPGLDRLRPIVIGLGLIAALVVCYRRRVALGPSVLRVALEGVGLALVLGPLLVFSTRLFGASIDVLRRLTRAGAGDPELADLAQAFGGSAYEELLFRVLVYPLCYLATSRALRFARAGETASRLGGEVVGALGSSATFAAFHLASWTSWLGIGGEPFQPEAFTWRFLAGFVLAIVFRWRGPGVAAWGHGLFNAWLLLGADPATLL